MKIQVKTKNSLLALREHFQNVLKKDLGRAPSGNKLNQLTAHLLKQPNFETAVAIASNTSKGLLESYIDKACIALSIDSTPELINYVESCIEKANQYSKDNSTSAFDESEPSSYHRVGCFVLNYHIDQVFSSDLDNGYHHPKYAEDNPNEFIDELTLNAAVKFKDYFFYKLIEGNVSQWSYIARHWVDSSRSTSECKDLARLTIFTMDGLIKIFADHVIHENLIFDFENRMSDVKKHFSISQYPSGVESLYDEEQYWLEKATELLWKSFPDTLVGDTKIKDGVLLFAIKLKRMSNEEVPILTGRMWINTPKMTEFEYELASSINPTESVLRSDIVSVIGSTNSIFYYDIQKLNKILDSMEAKMK